jgi:hypothetical protein
MFLTAISKFFFAFLAGVFCGILFKIKHLWIVCAFAILLGCNRKHQLHGSSFYKKPAPIMLYPFDRSDSQDRMHFGAEFKART